MNKDSQTTKILFVDENETSFQIWQCIARALDGLPPLELLHATDASDGLQKLDSLKPDAIVLNVNDEQTDEARAFVDSLFGVHPPVIVHADAAKPFTTKTTEQLIFVDKAGSLECMHKTLLVATAAAQKNVTPKLATDTSLH